MVIILPESPEDITGIFALNEQAFGGSDEAHLVDRLRAQHKIIVSLVAKVDDQLVGHILFSLVTVELDTGAYRAAGLAPMAVLPQFQNQGIGSRLVKAGLEECRQAGYEAVVVLGHPGYYPRFGFRPASVYGLTCEYNVLDEVFMALELREGAWRGRSGKVKYQPEFAENSSPSHSGNPI